VLSGPALNQTVVNETARRGLADRGGVSPIRVGVTGHINLTSETARLVAVELRSLLRGVRDQARASSRMMVGISCLAPGADSVFAEVLLSLGGRLEVILPSPDYGRSQFGPADAVTFDRLLRRAESVRTTAEPRASRAAYIAANNKMLDAIDHLVAVWDGQDTLVPGGTAHVVETARARSMLVTVIWPEGARRS
jgi:hypothetical protein